MTPINFNLYSESYQLLPHTGFEAVLLHSKVNGVVGDMVNLIPKGSDAGSASFSAIAGAFAGCDKEDFKWLVETTLKNVTVTTEGKKNESLSDMDKISAHFAFRLNKMYDLLFEVWDREKMLPFELVPGTEPQQNGNETKETGTSQGA